jgi:hypothetical protein
MDNLLETLSLASGVSRVSLRAKVLQSSECFASRRFVRFGLCPTLRTVSAKPDETTKFNAAIRLSARAKREPKIRVAQSCSSAGVQSIAAQLHGEVKEVMLAGFRR